MGGGDGWELRQEGVHKFAAPTVKALRVMKAAARRSIVHDHPTTQALSPHDCQTCTQSDICYSLFHYIAVPLYY